MPRTGPHSWSQPGQCSTNGNLLVLFSPTLNFGGGKGRNARSRHLGGCGDRERGCGGRECTCSQLSFSRTNMLVSWPAHRMGQPWVDHSPVIAVAPSPSGFLTTELQRHREVPSSPTLRGPCGKPLRVGGPPSVGPQVQGCGQPWQLSP